MQKITHILYMFFVLVPFVFVTFSKDCHAADFSVNPVRVFFNNNDKIQTLQVTNNSEDKVTLQLSVKEWTQNEKGEDNYTSSEDIIVFPRIFTMEKHGEQVIRLGIRVPPGQRERTYRVYLEEILQPDAERSEGSNLRTLVKIGVPIFTKPLQSTPAAAVEDIVLKGGYLSFALKNTGNTHFITKSVKIHGMDSTGQLTVDKEFAGWYLLAGSVRPMALQMSEDDCQRLTDLEITVLTDRLSMNERLDVRKEMCSE